MHDGDEMKPVAWMYYDERKTLRLCQTMPPDDNSFPVYTAPQDQTNRIAELEKWYYMAGNDLKEQAHRIWELELIVKQYENTAPRELSDEEIMEIFTAYEQMQEYGYVGKKPFKVSLGWSLSERNDCLMLARAILKKASEK